MRNLINFLIISLLTGHEVLFGQANEDFQGQLIVRIVSPFGGKMPKGRLLVKSTKTSQINLVQDIEDETTINLPYGEYNVSFETKFVRNVQRNVTLDKARYFLVLAADLDETILDVKEEPVSISFRIHPNSSCGAGEQLWAKLLGAFTDQALENKVESGGYALFEPLEVGTYVAMVIDGEQIRGLQTVRTRGPVTIVDMSLTPCK
jgi:hypothetical protein